MRTIPLNTPCPLVDVNQQSSPSSNATASPKNQLGCDKEWDSNVAREIVAGTLAVELAGAEVDVRGAVAVDPRLGLDSSGAGIAGVEGNRLEDREHLNRSGEMQMSASV